MSIKGFLKAFVYVDESVRGRMALAKLCYRIPVVGFWIGMLIDRTLFWSYGLDLRSDRVRIAQLTMAHPGGVLLGGNGIVSRGRVAIMAGVKFVGRSPNDPEFLARHREGRVFQLGDNVVIGANSVIVGPVDICDDVTIATMSLVNRSIHEPGLYAGIPVRKIKEGPQSDEWVAHLPVSGEFRAPD